MICKKKVALLLMVLSLTCQCWAKDYLYERLMVLKNKGFDPQVIYDIGAHHGDWTMGVREIFNQAQFFLFEANETNETFLKKLNAPYFIKVLGDSEKLVTFFTNGTTGDSVLREQTHAYLEGACNENTVQMTTLGKVLQENELPLPDMIKMDVQGAETLIIKGSPAVVLNAEIVILETKILEYNEGAPLIDETINLMNALGYRLLDITELHYLPDNELSEVDLLFVKKDSKLIKKGILW